MDISAFFASYVAAFDDFDYEAIANHYHFPAILASLDSVNSFADRSEAEAYFKRVTDHHRRIGYHTAQGEQKEIRNTARNVAEADIYWTFKNKSGKTLVEFEVTYTVVDYGQGPRVIFGLVKA